MDNFLAAYLAIGLGVIFLLAGFYFKKLVLFIISTLAWFIVTFFCLSDYATSNELYVLGLGVFAFAVAITAAITPYYYLAESNAATKKSDAQQMQDDYTEYHNQVGEIRNLRNIRRGKR